MKKNYDQILLPYNNNIIETRTQQIPAGKPLIGISLPGISTQRWIQDGFYLKENLENLGYDAEVQFAHENGIVQLSQIEDFLTRDAKGLIIAPVNPFFLQFILGQAKTNGIPVIAYDRLIMGTDAVDYYVSFNNIQVGTLLGEYIEDKLGLKEGNGPFNIEFFGGSPDDNNAYIVGNSMYQVLGKYVNNGQLVVPSGETTFSQVWTIGWSSRAAKERMSKLLNTYYKDKPLHAVASPSDSITSGIVEALEEAGYTPGANWPIITGQDAEIEAVRRIIEGKQSMTVFKDVRITAENAARIMDNLLKGEPIETNEFASVFNGVIMVPAYFAEPVTVDETNYREVLIDSGYYTEEQIFGGNENVTNE